MASTCSAIGSAYAPTLPATVTLAGMAPKSTLSSPADSSWRKASPGARARPPAGSSRLSCQPISALAWPSTASCASWSSPDRKRTVALSPSTSVFTAVSSPSTG